MQQQQQNTSVDTEKSLDHPSLASSKTLSKSIDSLESIKSKMSIKEIKERAAPNFAMSVDMGVNMKESGVKPGGIKMQPSVAPISGQRSIDYPYIKRKNPPLSEIVRKRLLFKKLSHDLANSGDSFSNSVEKDHVPKVRIFNRHFYLYFFI